jgi:hypothetical protein
MKSIRLSLGLLLVATAAAFVVLPAGPALAAHCTPSDEWSHGTFGYTIKGVWTCDATKYKWYIRTYVQMSTGGGFTNVPNKTSTNTKYQTYFIKDTRGSSYCTPTTGISVWYRVVIDFAHVWARNPDGTLRLLSDYSTEGWIGPSHFFPCT